MISMRLRSKSVRQRIRLAGGELHIERKAGCMAKWLKREARTHAVRCIGPGIEGIDWNRRSIDDERMEVVSIFAGARNSVGIETRSSGGLLRMTDYEYGGASEMVPCFLRLQDCNGAQDDDGSEDGAMGSAPADELVKKVHMDSSVAQAMRRFVTPS